MLISFFFKLLSFQLIGVENSRIKDEDVGSQFQKDGIVPDIIDEGPSSLLSVEYRNQLVAGQTLTPNDTKESPRIINWGADEGKTYILIMLGNSSF